MRYFSGSMFVYRGRPSLPETRGGSPETRTLGWAILGPDLALGSMWRHFSLRPGEGQLCWSCVEQQTPCPHENRRPWMWTGDSGFGVMV